MGYHSTIELNVTIGKVDEFRKYLNYLEEKDNRGEANPCEVELSLLYVEESWLTTDEPYVKWDHYDEWIREIAKFELSGNIQFLGSDGERWGYIFEDGCIYNTEYYMKKGEKLPEKEIRDDS